MFPAVVENTILLLAQKWWKILHLVAFCMEGCVWIVTWAQCYWSGFQTYHHCYTRPCKQHVSLWHTARVNLVQPILFWKSFQPFIKAVIQCAHIDNRLKQTSYWNYCSVFCICIHIHRVSRKPLLRLSKIWARLSLNLFCKLFCFTCLFLSNILFIIFPTSNEILPQIKQSF